MHPHSHRTIHVRHNYFNHLLTVTAFCVALLLFSGCDNPKIDEKWIGFYTYPNDETKFAFYMDLTIEDGVVTGRAWDGNMEEAIIGGTIDGGSYSLTLHPEKQGKSKSQDLYYRGIRVKDSIVGEWEHVVGVIGSWNATVTDLAPADALKLYQLPCPKQNLASGNSTKSECGKDA